MTILLGRLMRFLNYEFSETVRSELKERYGYEELERIPQTRHNYSFRTSEGTIVKYFTNFSLVELDLTIFHLLHGNLSVPTAVERAEAEVEFREKFPEINTPEIVNIEDRVIEGEEIEGENLIDAVEKGEIDPYEMGKEIGDIISKIEDKNYLFWDITPEDFMVKERLWLTDAEWFSEGSSSAHRTIIKGGFYASSKKLGPEDKKKLRKGYEDKMGDFTSFQKIYGFIAYYLF